jgi:hypothetical protein
MREADFGFVAVFSNFKSDLCAIPLGPGVKPGFAAPDPAVLFGYTTRPLELAPGIQPGSPDSTICRTEASWSVFSVRISTA